MFEKLGAGVGQGDRAFGAIEQPHSELALDVLYLLCQRGWADVEPFCRTREVQFFRQRDEVAEMAEFHARISQAPHN